MILESKMKIWKLESQTPEYTEIVAYWVNKPSVLDLKHCIANTFLSEDMLNYLLDQGKVNILYWDYLLEEVEVIENDMGF